MVLAALLAIGLWLITWIEAPLGETSLGLGIFVVSLLAGLRLGEDAGRRFASDLRRQNRLLAEQNADLAQQNQMLLRRLLEPADAE
ncbi:MAG: hypothetical protein DCC67_19990 [Planctomycetota bacterium]|nr:MAG: hypothetical protein DCC67_19990 [Planctomycetota bacterium]